MGFLGQFGSLFWKNYVIRKRHPGFVVLELVWPILIFVVLAVMRSGFPPDHRDTCEFQERSLPSAGMVSFLQSSICQLENNCSSKEWNTERTEAQKSFRDLLTGVAPILEKPTTVEAFKALPKVNAVLNAVKEFANKTDLKKIDDKLKLKNLFRDPDKVVEIIAMKYGVMSVKMTEYFLESAINPMAILDRIGNLDFKEIVCDPDQLSRYLIVYSRVNKYSLSTALCKIDDSKVSNITNELIKQLDIANIIRIGQDFANMTSHMDYAELMRDIASLVERYLDDSSLISMVSDFPDLSSIPGALRKMAQFLPVLIGTRELNLDSVQQMIDFALPFLNMFIEDFSDTTEGLMDMVRMFTSTPMEDMTLEGFLTMLPEMLQNNTALQQLFANVFNMTGSNDLGISDAMAMIQEITKNMTEIDSIGDMLSLMQKYVPDIMKNSGLDESLKIMLNLKEVPYGDFLAMMKNLTSTEDPGKMIEIVLAYVMPMLQELGVDTSMMSSVNSDMFSDLMNGINNGSVPTESKSTNKSLAELEAALRGMLGNETTDMMMAMSSNMMDMMDTANAFYKDFNGNMEYTVQNNPEVKVSIETLEQMGPEVSYRFLSEMVSVDNLYNLMSGEASVNDVCMSSAEVSLPSATMTTAVCSTPATQAVQTVVDSSGYTDMKAKMDVYMVNMDSIMGGNIPDEVKVITMPEMYTRGEKMITNMVTSMTDSSGLYSTMAGNETSKEVYSYLDKLWMEYTVHTRMMMPIVLMLQSAEKTAMWSSLETYVNMMDAGLNTAVQRFKYLEEMEEKDKTISRLAKYYPYMPYLLQSAIGTNMTKVSMLTSKLNDTGAMFDMLCMETDWASLNFTDVSVSEVQTYFCNLDMEKLAMDIYTLIDPMSFMAEIENASMASFDNRMDWPRMVSNLQYAMDTYNMRNDALQLVWMMINIDVNMVTSYMDIFQKAVTDITSGHLMESLANGDGDITSILANIDEVMGALPIWNRVKHYVRTWRLFAEAMNVYAYIIDDGNFTLVTYMKDISPTLGEYFEDATTTVPGLVEKLQDNLNNPAQMLERLVSVDFGNLCGSNSSLSELLGVEATPEFKRWQQGLCNLNWTNIQQEMLDSKNAKIFGDFLNQFEVIMMYSTDMLPAITINWTEVVHVTEEFIQNAQTTLFTTDMINFPDLGIDGFNMSGVNLIESLMTTWNIDDQLKNFLSNMDKLVALFGTPEPDSVMYMIKSQIQYQIYSHNAHMEFIITHLDIINRTGVFDLRQHINSPELNKILELLDKPSDLNMVLLHNVKLMLEDNSKVFELLGSLNMTSLCLDPDSAHWLEIPAGVSTTRAEVVGAICAAADMNTLIEEVVTSMEGLQDLINMYELFFDDNHTLADIQPDYSKMYSLDVQYAALMDSLSNKDIKIGASMDLEAEVQKIMEQFANFTIDWEKMANTSQQGQMMSQGLDLATKRVLSTVDIVVVFMTKQLNSYSGNISREDISGNSTNMNKLLQALEHLKSGLENQDMALLINETIDFAKLYELIENPSLILDHCHNQTLAAHISYMGQVSNITAALQELMCIDENMLNMLAADQIEQDKFEQELMRIWNDNVTDIEFDMEAFNKHVEEFITQMITLMYATPTADNTLLDWLEWGTVMDFFMNMTTPENIQKIVTEVAGPLAEMFMVDARLFRLVTPIMEMINELQSTPAEELLSDPTKLLAMMNKVLKMEDFINLLSSAIMPKEPSRQEIIEKVLKSEEFMTLSMQLPGLSMDKQYIIYIYGQDEKDWNSTLLNVGFTQTDVDHINEWFTWVVDQKLSEYRSEREMYENILKQLETSLSYLQMNTTANWLDAGLYGLAANGYDQLMTILRLFESDQVTEVHQALLVTLKVHEHINNLLKKLDGTEPIPITSVLPSGEALGKLLEGLSGGDSAETLMVAFIYPKEFLDLVLEDKWEETVCDMARLNATFVFPPELDLYKTQQKLCMEARNNQTDYVREIFQSVNLQKLMEEIEKITSNSSAVFNRAAYDRMMAVVEKLIGRMTGLGNVSLTGTDSWLEGLLQVLENMNAQTQTDLETSCTAIIQELEGLPMYQDTIKPYMDSFYTFIKISDATMTLQIDMYETTCESGSRNITAILKRLTDMKLADRIQQLQSMMSGEGGIHEFSCASMSEVYSFFERAVVNLMEAFNRTGTLMECVGDVASQAAGMLEDVSKLAESGNELLLLLRDPDVRAFMDTFIGSEEAQKLVDQIVDLFEKQEQAMKQWEALLSGSMNDTKGLIEDILKQSTDTVVSVVQEIFADQIGNMTAQDLIDYFCENDGTLNGELLNISLSELNNTLCGGNRNLSLELANNLLKYSQQLTKWAELASYNSAEFWQMIAKDVSALVGNIEGLSTLANLASSLGNIDIARLSNNTELLDALQTLLTDHGPDAILENLNKLLDNFMVLDNSNLTNALLDDIRYLADGIFAFTSLRDKLIDSVHIRDLLKDPASFRTYMVNMLGLSEEVADAIIDGSLSLELLLKAYNLQVSNWLCNSTELAAILKFNENMTELTADYVSEQFCNLPEDTIQSLLQELMNELDIGDLVEDLVNAEFGTILAKANMTVEETQTSVKALVEASNDLTQMTETFNLYAQQNSDAFANLAQAQTGSQEFGSMSSIICGTQLPPIDDEFNVGENLEQGTSELNERQQAEYNQIKGDSCKQMYTQIISERNGPIIWAYLKPLLRGKILYTPNTPEVAAIMAKANSTFDFLQNFTAIAKDWASGSEVLKSMAGDEADKLRELFDSELVRSLFMEVGGVESTAFDNLLYTFQGADTDLMTSISKVATLVSDYVECIEMNRFVALDTEEDLEYVAARLSRNNNLMAGIVFETSNDSGRKKRSSHALPTKIKYKIRMDIDNVPRTQRLKTHFWRPQPEDHFFDEMRYFRGFIQLQDMLESAILEQFGEELGVMFDKPEITTQQFPFPCHTLDPFVNVLAAYLLPVLMTASWIAGIAVAVYNLVYDRERGQEENLRIIGLRCGLNFWAWLLTSFFLMAIVAVVDIIILKYANIFTESNMLIVYLYFLDFIVSVLMMSYCVSAFFTRTSMAILTVLIVYFMSYLPFVVLYTLEVDMVFWQKTLACLSSTTAFSYAAQYIARYEEQILGIQWSNVATDPLYDDGFSFQWCCVMIIIDAVIYFLIGWYVRNVKPGKYGVGEPWYFIFTPSRWCMSGDDGDRQSNYAPSNQNLFREETQPNVPIALSARALSKTFSDGTQAVRDLNLDIYCGDVTTLLGHNGAAKTTTMNMLTGLLSPTSGSVQLLNRPLKSMRGSIGVCSQHNALYEYMTVQEHMEFVSSIKDSFHGLSKKDEIKQLLRDVDLYHCRDMLVRHLSGGMQRRLSIALAFVGGSKAVVLDEPTSGVDPSGRRAIWNMIIRRKAGVAVLLSTHHLDEADVISDQIAILHNGRLLCQGSPMFLKQHLASGHRMTVIAQEPEPDPAPILGMIQQWIPGARLQQRSGSDLTFVLPAVSGTDFYQFFQVFEEQKQALGVVSYGISDPQLQEVFMKVCATADAGHVITPDTVATLEQDAGSDSGSSSGSSDWKHDFDGNGGSRERLSKISKESSCMGILGALLTKRFLHYMRNWRLLLSVVILPMLLFLLACGLYMVRPEETNAPSLVLTPALYGPNTYVFKKDQSSPSLSTNGQQIVDTFQQKPGIGVSCMDNVKPTDFGSQFQCREPDAGFTATKYPTPACECVDNKYECSGDVMDWTIPEMNTTTTEQLQNLDNVHINDYLLASFDDFIMKRYGGWEFVDSQDSDGNSLLHAKVWYNNKGYHALPSFYNALSNGLLRSMVEKSGETKTSYGITAYNHPFMFSKERLSVDTMVYHAADIGIALIIMIAFTFIPVGALLYSVTENINHEKHMQFITGVSSSMYWVASLLWDLVILGVTLGLAVIVLVIFKPESFWNQQNLEAVVCLVALYGFSTITFSYCVSKRFRTAGAAFFTMFCLLNFIGVITVLIIFTLNYTRSESQSMREAYRVMQYVLLVFPPYALGGGLLELIDNQVRTIIYERFDVNAYQEPFTFDMIGWNLFAMGVEGVVFFILAIWMDARCCCNNRPKGVDSESSHMDEDPDVAQEKARIDRGDCRSDAVIVRQLHKIYSKGKTEIHAVNDLSFGVPENQCFGLLGVNGAGKTSTFKILTGDTSASDGFTSVLGRRILQGSRSAGQSIGYCPQEDALDGYLTVESSLYFHAKLKGIPSDRRKEEVDRVMEKLQLHSIKGKTVRTCSGGMKRKLSLGIALLGEPPVLLLDEPTTGMDPKAKKLVWDCLLKSKQNRQAIILTSHSLEECDMLCDRIGIMVNGEFKCLGSSQHLKQKFGNGYTVTLYVCGLSTSTTRIYELIQTHFPCASIRDQHCNVIQLDIPRESVTISDMFRVLENEKSNYNITYYTVSQITLDTIFLNFAREQTDGGHVDYPESGSSSGKSDSNLGTNAATNPYYMQFGKPAGGIGFHGDGDKEKSIPEKSPAYVLPIKDTFDDGESDSYSTKL